MVSGAFRSNAHGIGGVAETGVVPLTPGAVPPDSTRSRSRCPGDMRHPRVEGWRADDPMPIGERRGCGGHPDRVAGGHFAPHARGSPPLSTQPGEGGRIANTPESRGVPAPRVVADRNESRESARKRKNPRGRCKCSNRGGGSSSAPDRIRTCDLRLRRPTLYPAELRARARTGGRRISRVLSPARAGESHFSGTGVAAGLEQPTRNCARPGVDARGGQPLVPVWPCSGWGLPCPRRCRRGGALLPQPFHPCLCPRRGPSAVCSLWHFPSPRDARPLAGTLPCGARTFLDALTERRGPHSPPVPVLSNISAQERTRTSTPVKAPDP